MIVKFCFPHYREADPEPAPEPKSGYPSAELQDYIEGIFKPTHDDIELAINLVCNSSEKLKVNGINRNFFWCVCLWIKSKANV